MRVRVGRGPASYVVARRGAKGGVGTCRRLPASFRKMRT
jgi:hypothetical protein